MVSPIDTSSDGHVHTRLCRHATGEMEEYIQSAIGKKLRSLTFLEHLEAGVEYRSRTWLDHQDFTYYFQEGKRLQEKYQGQLVIRLGIEVGYNPEAIDHIEEKLALYPYQRLGLSYHFYRVGKKHLNLLSKRLELKENVQSLDTVQVLDDYFSGLRLAAERFNPDVLCHMDAALRHWPGIALSAGNMDHVEALLDVMQDKSIGLEINTSGYAIRPEPFPCKTIVRSALRRNIKLFPGSDAHSPDQVGRYFDRLPEYIRQLQAT